MLQLNNYYSQCIGEVEMNMSNILKYFQQKAFDVNSHYKNVVDRVKNKI